MSIAQTIANIIGAEANRAYTLAGGYLIRNNGRRILFPTGRMTRETRNEKGRCTLSVLSYPDGSELTYTYHPMHGSSLKVANGKDKVTQEAGST